MKSRKSRVILGIVILLVVVGGIAFAYIRSNAQAAASTTSNLQTTTASLGNISSSVVAAGTVSAKQSATLGWKATGTVGTVDVQVGQVVTAGQQLASLSTSDIPQNVISAEADLVAAQQALSDLLNSTTAQAQALQTLQNAQNALNNYQNNFPSIQAATKANLTTAQNKLAIAQNRLDTMVAGQVSQPALHAAQAAYAQAVAAVNAAQATVDSLSGSNDPQYAAARANLGRAQNTRDAAWSALQYALNKPSATDIANQQAAVAQAQAVVAQAQQAWDLVKDGPDQTQLSLLQAKLADAQRAAVLVKNGPNPNDVIAAKARVAGDQSIINEMKITAPFDGTITDVSSLVNDQVSPGTAAFRIDDLAHLEVIVTVAEFDIPNIKVGMPAVITFDALNGKSYDGKVTEVSPVGITSQGVVNFNVTVELTNPDKNVLPGLTAAVSIITASKQNVMILPNKAIKSSGGQHVVTILSEGNQVTVPVTLGLTNDTSSEIASGNIHDGDTVVLNPSSVTTTTTGRGGIFGIFRGIP